MAWRRHEPAESAADIADWCGGGLTASYTTVPGRRGRPRQAVRIDTGTTVAAFDVGDMRALARGRAGVAETIGEPTVFLARVAAASPDSPAGQQVKGLPGDAVVLLLSDPSTAPAAVLDAAKFAEFAAWVQALP